MAGKYTVDDFVTLKGKVKRTGSSSTAQQANIYLWLRAQGFGRAVVQGRSVFFKKTGGKVQLSTLVAMRYAFLAFLETHDFEYWPAGVTRHDLIEWFYATRPPARSALFQDCLFTELSQTEISQLTGPDEKNPATTDTLNFLQAPDRHRP